MGSGKGKTRRAKSAANIGQAVPGSDVDPRGAPMLPSGAPDYHIKDFSTGFCHLFALALHERYGWKLRALGEPEDEYSLHPWGAGMGSSITHVYCLNKQGLPVDVNGTFGSEEAIQHFYTHELEPDAKMLSIDISEDEIRSKLVDRGYTQVRESEMKLTRKVVKKLALSDPGEIKLAVPEKTRF